MLSNEFLPAFSNKIVFYKATFGLPETINYIILYNYYLFPSLFHIGCTRVFQAFPLPPGGHAFKTEEPKPTECHSAAVQWNAVLCHSVRCFS